MKHCLLPFALLLLVNFSFAQTAERSTLPERRPGEILVQFSPQTDLEKTLALLNEAGRGTVTIGENLAPDWNIYVLQFGENQVVASELLAAARRLPSVQSAQFNHRAAERGLEPNDPEWWRQDDMTLIGADEAWESSTGGITPAGDTIVVAVLEKGILVNHPDLEPNRWYNRGEKNVDDGIDNDGNGYVDDYSGWDVQTESNAGGGADNHGTAVSGIIGARGNNGIGVTGVNWNVKLMGITGVDFESQIIAGHYYARNMRRLYNQSNGAKGAFVVAANVSFGFDRAKPEDHPIWCAVYDSLGKVGILGIGATANQNINVDIEGDIPTNCPSEYLIAVNNTNKFGSKMPNTGYGSVSIDLGAPGEGSYNTANLGNTLYGTLGGTSCATPHVTGAVALLYSMPCDKLTSDALTNPAACARRVRDVILDNVEPESTLEGVTTTGGYLQVSRATEAVRELCDGLSGPLTILEVRTLAQDRFEFYYQTPTFDKYNFRVFNMLGQLLYEEELVPQPFGINYIEYDASDLPAAVYVVSIGREKNVVSRKFPKF
jgi:hypothetical protein